MLDFCKIHSCLLHALGFLDHTIISKARQCTRGSFAALLNSWLNGKETLAHNHPTHLPCLFTILTN